MSWGATRRTGGRACPVAPIYQHPACSADQRTVTPPVVTVGVLATRTDSQELSVYTLSKPGGKQASGPSGLCPRVLVINPRLRDVVSAGRGPAGGLHSVSHVSKPHPGQFSKDRQREEQDGWTGAPRLRQPGSGCGHSHAQLQQGGCEATGEVSHTRRHAHIHPPLVSAALGSSPR